MRNVYLFLAASLGCLVLSAISLAAPQAILTTLFPDSDAAKRVQCSRLLKSYRDGHKDLPQSGTPEQERYYECYVLMCGRPGV